VVVHRPHGGGGGSTDDSWLWGVLIVAGLIIGGIILYNFSDIVKIIVFLIILGAILGYGKK